MGHFSDGYGGVGEKESSSREGEKGGLRRPDLGEKSLHQKAGGCQKKMASVSRISGNERGSPLSGCKATSGGRMGDKPATGKESLPRGERKRKRELLRRGALWFDLYGARS